MEIHKMMIVLGSNKEILDFGVMTDLDEKAIEFALSEKSINYAKFICEDFFGCLLL